MSTTTPLEFEIVSFLANPNGSDSSTFKPHTVRRTKDNELFQIGDEVTNGEMTGTITGFSLLENKGFVDHTWSGVGMWLENLHKVITLPSRYQIKQVVYVTFPKADPNSANMEKDVKLTATVVAVHFYSGTMKYDLDIWVERSESSTRVYNVDSDLIQSA